MITVIYIYILNRHNPFSYNNNMLTSLGNNNFIGYGILAVKYHLLPISMKKHDCKKPRRTSRGGEDGEVFLYSFK